MKNSIIKKSIFSNTVILLLIAVLVIGSSVACSGKDKSIDNLPSESIDGTTGTQAVSQSEPSVTTQGASETTAAETTPIPPRDDDVNPLTGLADMNPENAGKRSVAIVVNNHIASIPQRGLHKADVIYEYETEGGQTRLLAVFADLSAVPEIGSLRSARIVSSDLCAGTNSIYIHFGSNKRVPDHLYEYGIQDVDGNAYCAGSGHSVNGEITLSDGLFFYRDDAWRSKRAIEHTAVTNGSLLMKAIDYRGISLEGETPMLFDFVDSGSPSLSGGTPCTDMTVFFSNTNNDSNFVYDKDIGLYSKYQYNGTAQIDEITGEKIYVKNVIVLFANIQGHGDGTVDAFLEDGGEGYYVSDGKIIHITWDKDSPVSLIRLFDDSGEPVLVNAGRSYINVVRQTQSEKTTWE